MPSGIILNQVDVVQSARVQQMAGLFDVPLAEKSQVELAVNLPIEEKDWRVGLIVGPSGCGKSSIVREFFGEAVSEFEWSSDRALLDDFPKTMGIKEVCSLLTSVGFGSAPNWMRPYRVLSNGEQFRATVARAIAESDGLVVIDEFTSVVDRQVAQVASSTIAKAIRRSDPPRQLIAVSCHYDVLEWLQPDWVYQPQGNQFQRRCLRRRPNVELKIYPVSKAVWPLFSKYHYLSAELGVGAQCFGAFVGDECIAFTSYLNFPHMTVKNIKMGHRLVVHPDWQGLGIGGHLCDWLGQYLYDRGFSLRYCVAHPGMIHYLSRSPRWELARSGFTSKAGRNSGRGVKSANNLRGRMKKSAQRPTSSFYYKPPA